MDWNSLQQHEQLLLTLIPSSRPGPGQNAEAGAGAEHTQLSHCMGPRGAGQAGVLVGSSRGSWWAGDWFLQPKPGHTPCSGTSDSGRGLSLRRWR